MWSTYRRCFTISDRQTFNMGVNAFIMESLNDKYNFMIILSIYIGKNSNRSSFSNHAPDIRIFLFSVFYLENQFLWDTKKKHFQT